MKKYLLILGPAVAVLTALAASQGFDVQPIKDAICGKNVPALTVGDAGAP